MLSAYLAFLLGFVQLQSQVPDPPVIRYIRGKNILYWENLTLHCAVSGAKPLTVQWMKDDHVIPSKGPVHLDQHTTNCLDDINCTIATLRVDSLSSKEVGDYICASTNKDNNASARIYVKKQRIFNGVSQVSSSVLVEKASLIHMQAIVRDLCSRKTHFLFCKLDNYQIIPTETVIINFIALTPFEVRKEDLTRRDRTTQINGIYVNIDSIGYQEIYDLYEAEKNISIFDFWNAIYVPVQNFEVAQGFTVNLRCQTQPVRHGKLTWWRGDTQLHNVPNKIDIFHGENHTVLTIHQFEEINDEIYTCAIKSMNRVDKIQVKVNYNPEIRRPIVQSYPATVFEGETATVRCDVSNNVPGVTKVLLPVQFSWFINGEEIFNSRQYIVKYEKLSSELSIIAIQFSAQPVNITCEASNKIGGSSIKTKITTLSKAVKEVCQPLEEDGVIWPLTRAGEKASSNCPPGAAGVAVRECIKQSDGEILFGDADFTDCVSAEFAQLLSQTDKNLTVEAAAGAVRKLVNITESSNSMLGGDLIATNSIMKKIADSGNNKKDIPLEESDNMVKVANNVLNLKNSIAWQNVQKKQVGSMTVTENLEKFGFNINITVNKNVTIDTENIVFQVQSVPGGENSTVTFTNPSKDDSTQMASIKLPPELFLNNSDRKSVTVVNAAYKSLNRLLPNSVACDDSQNLGNVKTCVNSMIISSTTDAPQHDNFAEPVEITLSHNTLYTKDRFEKVDCVFWDKNLNSARSGDWSTEGCETAYFNDTVTICKCYHLTNFAILMSLSPEKIPETIARALTIITTVGCSLSITALTITIIVFIYTWRYLKRVQAVFHLNLSLTLLLANLLLLTGLDKVNSTNFCIAVAFTLHFLFLSAFMWMLMEAANIYFMVNDVFSNRMTKLRYYIALSYGLPLLTATIVIAAIGSTLGLKYYTNKHACWLSVNPPIIVAFIGPAVTIILLNTIVLIMTVKAALSTKKIQSSKQKYVKARTAIKGVLVLTPLLGITWIIGLFSFNNDLIVFQFLFAIANSLQVRTAFTKNRKNAFISWVFNSATRKSERSTSRKNMSSV
ncbi:Adhesion G protein-coupled receptor L2 [Trichoplax sp. H2]|nr:Adhesion G protein-coupled receptor L2 [Trichoplax sp. H2]|eukprot:RDD41208.1 Adhesion G protein-coupled receptor L2 [Trichoplax sp. H2]